MDAATKECPGNPTGKHQPDSERLTISDIIPHGSGRILIRVPCRYCGIHGEVYCDLDDAFLNGSVP